MNIFNSVQRWRMTDGVWKVIQHRDWNASTLKCTWRGPARRSRPVLTSWHDQIGSAERQSAAVYHHRQTADICSALCRSHTHAFSSFAVFICLWPAKVIVFNFPTICLWHVLHTTSTNTTNRQQVSANFKYWCQKTGRNSEEKNLTMFEWLKLGL